MAEALRLADWLEDQYDPTFNQEQAAAELRRLHAENASLSAALAASCDEARDQLWESGGVAGCSRALSAEFQRDALLKALKAMLENSADYTATRDQARAAIAAVEGEKT